MKPMYRHLAPWLLTITEAIMVLGSVYLCFRSQTDHSNSFLKRLETIFGRLARRRHLAVTVVGLSAVSIRLLLMPFLGVPLPAWNDEYSHLLAANTFASGRLTNPTHPMWVHFESFQIIQHPTYMSMYAPGQALVMAAGVVLGHPWIGILLITALLCATLCWMLQGWYSPRWALFGGLISVLRFATFSYWMNSYWCPALAAVGGALILGAIPRLRASPRVWHGILVGIGLAIMANSRPYEGLVFSVATGIGTLVWLRGRRLPRWPLLFQRLFIPAFCVLTIAGIATAYFYVRVTGSPLKMTYAVNRETYAVVPYFLFFSKRTVPHYNHEVMRDYYAGWEVQQFDEARTVAGFIRRTGNKVLQLWRFYVGPALSLPLVVTPWIVKDRRIRLAVVAGAVFSIGWLIETWTFPHYVAPATGLVYLVIIQCSRRLWLFSYRKGNVGRALVRSVPVVCVGMIVLRLAGIAAHAPLEPRWPVGNLDRIEVIAQLQQMSGGHLVIVRYGPEHNVDRDWVYNAPDIDASPIVWARDMGKSANEELLRYFNTRHAWLMYGDESPPRLEPYPQN